MVITVSVQYNGSLGFSAEPVSRDQIFRGANGDMEKHFSCAVDHEQDWQPYPVDPYAAGSLTTHTYIHTYIHGGAQGTLSLSKNCTSRESVSPLSRLIRGFRNKYH